MKRSTLILIIIVVLLLAAGGLGYNWYNNGPCGVKKVETTQQELGDIFIEWEDAVEIASSTSRISLSGPVSNLQSIQRDLSNLAVPVCMETAQANLYLSMDKILDAFLSFMADADADISSDLTLSGSYLEIYEIEIKKVQECAPFCEAE